MKKLTSDQIIKQGMSELAKKRWRIFKAGKTKEQVSDYFRKMSLSRKKQGKTYPKGH